MINLNNFIERLAEYERNINVISHDLMLRIKNDTSFFNYLNNVDQKYLNDIRLILIMTAALQISETESIYDSFELEDIAKIFDILVKQHKSNLDLNLEAIYFNYNVMTDNNRALALIIELEERLTAELSKIYEIKNEIQKEI
ncbi:hypothetical protein [Sphingobacterium sp. CZ-2]|uniref:hypothetical protein n=1 Tax=Sphingobacterium sp. CZ-2 TaxID=2557994 RepID=UPI00106F6845|nr:hypothetical protein [Sphingobacterium sp. CZ-2]QBR12177.1 hypothetical protein E3D81_08390 [Sphingobacterium sp. CZ-2]